MDDGRRISSLATVGIAVGTLTIGVLVGRGWREAKTPPPVIVANPPAGPSTNDQLDEPRVARLGSPKPSILPPDPILDDSNAALGDQNPALNPPVIPGDLPHLPATPLSGGIGPVAVASPLSPDLPATLPTADLNADEAAVRRLVLKSGGQVQSAQVAKDASGIVGRSLLVEIPATASRGLRSALAAKLHDRVLITEAGQGSSDPNLKKAEEELAAAKKERDQARIDFLPQAPALRQIEERYAALEKSVQERRNLLGRTRLNILLRPTLS